MRARTPGLVVLDDDPTGAQAASDVYVLFDWDDASRLRAEIPAAVATVHVLTNSRAYAAAEAKSLVRSAAEAAVSAFPGSRIVLRGDSTLRAHLLEEYEALRDVVYPGRTPLLLLVPALPAAGRVTVGGVHHLVASGVRTPLHRTEYARDSQFAYTSARLLRWAEERSGGFFATDLGIEVAPEEVEDALVGLVGPAVCAPDATSLDDLETIARGLERAEARGAEIVVRCAPAFASVLGRSTSPSFVPAPRTGNGVLVVCGSHVPATTRQLKRLDRAFPGSIVELDLSALVHGDAAREVGRVVGEAGTRLKRGGVAVVATPRARLELGVDDGRQVASGVAAVVAGLRGSAGIVISKGGITSAVVAREGLGARVAHVVGPVADGVSLWRVPGDGDGTALLVVPGNVGEDGLLADLMSSILAG